MPHATYVIIDNVKNIGKITESLGKKYLLPLVQESV